MAKTFDLNRQVAYPWLYCDTSVDIDHTLTLICETEDLAQKIRGYIIIAFSAGRTNPDLGLECVDSAERYAQCMAADDGSATKLLLARVYCLSNKRSFEEAYQRLASGKKLFSRSTTDDWQIYFHHLSAVAALHTNRFAEALNEAKLVLAHSYSSDIQPLRGRALATVGIVAGEFGMQSEAVKFFERARCASIVNAEAALPSVLSTNNIAWTQCLLAEDLLSRGRPDEARAVAARAVELARRAVVWAQTSKSLREEINAGETLVAALILDRQLPAARSQLDRLDALVRSESSDSGEVTRGIVSRGRLLLEDNDPLGAIALLEPMYVGLRGSMPRLHRSLFATLERAYLEARRFEDAYKVSRQAGELLRTSLRGDSESVLQTLIKNISSRHHDWLAYIAHDLRSPISSIVSTAQAPDDLQRLPTKMKRISDLGEAALSALGRYLDFARLDVVADQFKQIQFNELIEQALEFSSSKMMAKRLSVAHNADDHVVVEGDWDLLHRALANILDNAIVAAPEGTSLSLSTRIWNDTCIFNLCNDGKGFAAGSIAKLFDVQLQSPGATQNFGLPITAFIVESHRGAFSVQNRTDRSGVCATIVLPRLVHAADDE